MRKSYLLSNALMLLAMLLAACAPKATPTPEATQPPVIVTVIVTAAPSETPTEAVAEVTPTLEAINLAGPEMALHSTYLYVDRTLLVAVPAGPFTYGKKGGTDNPEITVTLGDYWIYQTEVTNQQYERCVKVGKCSSPNLEDNPSYLDPNRQEDPVTGVDWNQSRAYCLWVNADLPTEPQWEKAARGPDAFIYPWGNDAAPSCALLNFNNCVGKTTMVLSYDPQGKSYYDALDMSGNSYEWNLDIYDPFYYRNAPLEDPPGPETGERRSIRSGGYKSNKDQVPSFVRFFDFPNAHRRDLGFRCVVLDPAFYAPFCEEIPTYDLGEGSGGPNPGSDYICPIVSVGAAGQHCGSNSTYVTFNSNDASKTLPLTGVGGCALISGGPGFPQVYDCPGAGSADIDGFCTYPGAEATCDTNYILDEATGTCKWDTSIPVGTACPDGYVYDDVNHCCTAAPGSVADYPLCQAPYTLHMTSPGHFVCSNDPASPHGHVSWLPPAACGGENPYTGMPIITSPFYVALENEKSQLPVASVSGILTLFVLGLVGWVTRRGGQRT